jgi:hypothetical protein
MLTSLAVTSLTDFALSAEAFFLSGLLFARPKARYSAAWYWQWSVLLLALSAFIGGLDHGFVQVAGDTPVRKVVQHTTWAVIGLATAATVLAIVRQFVAARWHSALAAAAAIQYAVYLVAVTRFDTYAAVVVNYAPVMIWALVANVRGLRDGTGHWPIIAGIGAGVAASIAQAAGWRLSARIDHQGLYHIGMMVAVAFSYAGGLRLKGFRAVSRSGAQETKG